MTKDADKRAPRRYDDEFRANIIKVYKQDERTPKELAEDYGIPEGTLRGWLKAEEARSESVKGNDKQNCADLKELKKELAKVKEDRDILKKALAIFSMPPRS